MSLRYTDLLSSLFFYSSGDHPDLHSFPTRRSSDLRTTAMSRSRCRRAARISRPAVSAERCSGSASAPPARPSSVARSEEHTSELQSRPHLVCRLLLEKKKKKKKTETKTNNRIKLQ